jgi:hypothetical protein
MIGHLISEQVYKTTVQIVGQIFTDLTNRYNRSRQPHCPFSPCTQIWLHGSFAKNVQSQIDSIDLKKGVHGLHMARYLVTQSDLQVSDDITKI